MNEQHADTMKQITGQVRTLFYFVDEPTTTLTIQSDGQTIIARATGQVALLLRALPRGATIGATLQERHPTIHRSSPSPSRPPDPGQSANTSKEFFVQPLGEAMIFVSLSNTFVFEKPSTPAIATKLSDQIWTIKELLMTVVSPCAVNN